MGCSEAKTWEYDGESERARDCIDNNMIAVALVSPVAGPRLVGYLASVTQIARGHYARAAFVTLTASTETATATRGDTSSL